MKRFVSHVSPPASSIQIDDRDRRRVVETLGYREGKNGETMHTVESWGETYPRAKRFYTDYRRAYREGAREVAHHS